jgi:hypothetical protein
MAADPPPRPPAAGRAPARIRAASIPDSADVLSSTGCTVEVNPLSTFSAVEDRGFELSQMGIGIIEPLGYGNLESGKRVCRML